MLINQLESHKKEFLIKINQLELEKGNLINQLREKNQNLNLFQNQYMKLKARFDETVLLYKTA